jgi:hypothetical protein
MLAIDKVLISDEILEEMFVCDLSRCHGGCCVEGDAGAPLTKEEALTLEEIYDRVKPYLSEASQREIARQGKFVQNGQTGYVTPTVGNEMCVYGRLEGGIVKCGIEKAWQDGQIAFKKPISCHLYPIRVQQYDSYEAMNFEPCEQLCRPACILGNRLQVPVYRFLKEAIIRGYGQEFYEALEEYDQWRQRPA